jgi:hypothetical protein
VELRIREEFSESKLTRIDGHCLPRRQSQLPARTRNPNPMMVQAAEQESRIRVKTPREVEKGLRVRRGGEQRHDFRLELLLR